MKTEAKIQQSIVQYFRSSYCLKNHNPRCVIFSVPNESKNKMETMRKKAIGMMSGVSDLIVVTPNEVIFCEVKTETGTQSQKQKDFQAIIENLGYKYILVRSLEDFKNKVCYI